MPAIQASWGFDDLLPDASHIKMVIVAFTLMEWSRDAR
jgi:hypothetical protein